MNAYIVLALLIGARTEELRALTWDRLDLEGDPPTIQVWRSVRRDGRDEDCPVASDIRVAQPVRRGPSRSQG